MSDSHTNRIITKLQSLDLVMGVSTGCYYSLSFVNVYQADGQIDLVKLGVLYKRTQIDVKNYPTIH